MKQIAKNQTIVNKINLPEQIANDNQKITALFNVSKNEIIRYRGEIMDLFSRVENEIGNILYKLAKDKIYKTIIKNVQPQLGSMISVLRKAVASDGAQKNILKPLHAAFQNISILFEMRAIFAHAKVEILMNKDMNVVYVFELVRFDSDNPQILKIHYELQAIKDNKIKLNELLQKLSSVNAKIK